MVSRFKKIFFILRYQILKFFIKGLPASDLSPVYLTGGRPLAGGSLYNKLHSIATQYAKNTSSFLAAVLLRCIAL